MGVGLGLGLATLRVAVPPVEVVPPTRTGPASVVTAAAVPGVSTYDVGLVTTSVGLPLHGLRISPMADVPDVQDGRGKEAGGTAFRLPF